MALTSTQQIFETFNRANSVLVAFKHDPHYDGASSALALAQVLKKMDKRVVVAADNWVAPKELHFLPEIHNIQPQLEDIQKFIIEVDVGQTLLKDVSCDHHDG
ncbi:MAG: hypothetical protein Q8N56_04325, partial [bacterium]|nr:hypothetical protein [bacterium]